MAKSSGGGSVGGRRGGKVSAQMSMSQAKSLAKPGAGSKPTLGTTAKNNDKKVTNKLKKGNC
jgi:hypothetical protein